MATLTKDQYRAVGWKFVLTKVFPYTLSDPGWGGIAMDHPQGRENTAQYVGISGPCFHRGGVLSPE